MPILQPKKKEGEVSLGMLGKCSTTEKHPLPRIAFCNTLYSSLKWTQRVQEWWLTLVIPATQEVKIRRIVA
jgi:hypothetical protein